jgi:hypothetical protein
MKSNSVLFVGCGELGARAGRLLQRQGWQVGGVRRNISKLPAGFTGHGADYAVAGGLNFVEALQPDFVVTTFNPTERSVEGYVAGFLTATANLLSGLGGHKPRCILAASSTRVFAEQQGGWVDESSPLSTDDPRAQPMIEAERLLQASSIAASVVRFGGIYGAPGGRLLSRIARGELCPPAPAQYGNRMHRDDCAGFLAHLLCLSAAGKVLAPLYIGVDDQPVPRYEVESWLAREIGVEPQRLHVAPAVQASGGHKRCRNLALHDSGYELLYPDYRSGYRAVLNSL